jgi:hypothetical protein
MERHLSTGVATIVALMSAHRTACGRGRIPAAFLQKEVTRIESYLLEDEMSENASVRSPGRQDGSDRPS